MSADQTAQTQTAVAGGAAVAPPRGVAAGLLALIRPPHWSKNALVVPLVLVTGPALSAATIGRVLWSVLAFTLASSVIYIADDIVDRDRDRRHPVKRMRPVASGWVSVPAAALFGCALAGLLGLLIAFGPAMSWWPIAVFLALNAAYIGVLKHLPLIEMGVVASGFVLRLAQGQLAAGAVISGWLSLSLFCFCLALVLGKRRQELIVSGPDHRPALRGYSVELIDHLLQLTCALTALTCLLYLQDAPAFGSYAHAAMVVSAPFALFSVARYLQAVLVGGEGGDPVRTLLRDRALVAAAALWATALAVTALLAHHPTLARGLLP